MLRVIAEGFTFPEGPAFRGDVLFLVDLHEGCTARVRGGTVERLVYTGGRPNGLAFHPSGDLFVADNGLAAILRIHADHRVEVVASSWEGSPFQGPNDLIFDRAGRLYFTDPGQTFPSPPTGRVFRIDSDRTVHLVAEGLAFPNGIALSPDETALFVAETLTGRILVLWRDEAGNFQGPQVFAHVGGVVGPDGLAIDEVGNVYAAMYGDGIIRVISSRGELIRELPAGGQKPTNLTFGGPERRTLVVTEVESGAVYALENEIPGLRLYGDLV